MSWTAFKNAPAVIHEIDEKPFQLEMLIVKIADKSSHHMEHGSNKCLVVTKGTQGQQPNSHTASSHGPDQPPNNSLWYAIPLTLQNTFNLSERSVERLCHNRTWMLLYARKVQKICWQARAMKVHECFLYTRKVLHVLYALLCCFVEIWFSR